MRLSTGYALLNGATDHADYSTPGRPRRPRVASEKSDIAYLLATLNNLAELVTQDVLGMPGSAGPAKQYPLLRSAIWTAREAAIRVSKNQREREARAKAKR